MTTSTELDEAGALAGKRVVLGVTGGIAAYKAAELCRLLVKADATVRVIMTEAATRFAISHPAMGTILVGMATPSQFEDALAAVLKGPLSKAALDRLTELQRDFAGETR